MRGSVIYRYGRALASVAAVLVTALAVTLTAAPAFADTATITGTVVDNSDTPQANVAVEALDPATSAAAASTTTDSQGDFTVTVAAGTYNLEFTPPSGSGLQSYLATGVSTDSAPLTVILKQAVVVHVAGALEDSEGNVYTSQNTNYASLTFSSPSNPGSSVSPDASGNYSVDLLADQNVKVNAFVEPQSGAYMSFSLPVGTLDHDQAYNVTMPVSKLTVSVQDAGGHPITGGQFTFSYTSEGALPGIPGSSAYAYPGNMPSLDASGGLSVLVPNGITLTSPEIRLSSGLVIPFTLHPITGDRHALLIFNQTTGTVTVDDQPPVVTRLRACGTAAIRTSPHVGAGGGDDDQQQPGAGTTARSCESAPDHKTLST